MNIWRIQVALAIVGIALRTKSLWSSLYSRLKRQLWFSIIWWLNSFSENFILVNLWSSTLSCSKFSSDVTISWFGNKLLNQSTSHKEVFSSHGSLPSIVLFQFYGSSTWREESKSRIVLVWINQGSNHIIDQLHGDLVMSWLTKEYSITVFEYLFNVYSDC